MDDVIGSRTETIDERMAKATEKLEADFAKVDTKISRFPHGMRGIGGQDDPFVAPSAVAVGSQNDPFVAPSVVAIGPYHHGAPHLQKIEEAKLAAAYNLCRHSGKSTAQVYEKVLSVAGAARDCYDTDDSAVMGVSDADFATIMFLDGCFLLQYMVAGDPDHVLHNRMIRQQILSMGASIHKDVFLLENQIPWLVLDALTKFVPVDVRGFVYRMGDKFQARRSAAVWSGNGNVDHYKPPHLLGLLRFTLVGCLPEHVMKLNFGYDYNYDTAFEQSSSRSATELAEIGVVLTPSRETSWFGDMTFRLGRTLCELSLSPVFLNHVTACCLVNMAALEAISTGGASGEPWEGFELTSYLSVMAMLMDRMEDVEELRRRGLLHGSLSDMQALVLFKGLRHHLRFGGRHMIMLEIIRYRSMKTRVYKFVYHNYYKITAAIISITNVVSSVCTVLQTFKNGSNK